MEKTWTKALMDSISEVFSTMFFMVPENDADMEQSVSGDSADDWVEGWVELEGPDESVRLCVWAPVRAARELAANILSCELHELDGDDMLDAYREMLLIRRFEEKSGQMYGMGLIGSGMGKGPALALLLAGPALSLPNMLVIGSVMGVRKTVVFCLIIVSLSTLAGIFYGWIAS